MPPVLARLPEIVPESEDLASIETSDVISHGTSKGMSVRIDGAHANANERLVEEKIAAQEQPAAEPATPELPVDIEPAPQPITAPAPSTANATGTSIVSSAVPAAIPAAIDSLVVSNQVVSQSVASKPVLPPLPTSDFSDTAAKIMAQLENKAAEPNVSATVAPIGSAADETLENKSPENRTSSQRDDFATTGDSRSQTATTNLRIDPGIPKPSMKLPPGKKEFDEKRKIARGQTQPELNVLDSPWHDWIVKLGGTFIAGLLLIAAFQSLRPKTPVQHVGNDPQIESDLLAEPEFMATTPDVRQPGAFDAMLDPVTAPPEPAETPVFIDPDELRNLDESAQVVAKPDFEPIDIATPDVTTQEIATPSPPALDDLARDLMPAPAVNLNDDTIPALPSDDGNMEPEVAAVIDNKHVIPDETAVIVENSLTKTQTGLEGLIGPPNVTGPRVATAPNDPITPIAASPGAYPSTGFSALQPMQRPTATAQPTTPAQGTLAPQQRTRPQFNLFPQTGAPNPPQTGGVPAWNPEPRSPMSVQLNGTIQRYSR